MRAPAGSRAALGALALGAAARASSAPPPISVTESSAAGATWAARAPQAWVPAGAAPAIVFDLGAPRQEVSGFGAAFTDTSAYNALVYAEPAVRAAFVEAYWGASGLRASLMRVHINSPDYSVHTYSEDDVPGDFALAHFDDALAYDEQRLLPLIRLARAAAAAWTPEPIRLFASPWSPPAWMKTNENMINSGSP
jgi:glucosylceramidase